MTGRAGETDWRIAGSGIGFANGKTHGKAMWVFRIHLIGDEADAREKIAIG